MMRGRGSWVCSEAGHLLTAGAAMDACRRELAPRPTALASQLAAAQTVLVLSGPKLPGKARRAASKLHTCCTRMSAPDYNEPQQ